MAVPRTAPTAIPAVSPVLKVELDDASPWPWAGVSVMDGTAVGLACEVVLVVAVDDVAEDGRVVEVVGLLVLLVEVEEDWSSPGSSFWSSFSAQVFSSQWYPHGQQASPHSGRCPSCHDVCMSELGSNSCRLKSQGIFPI